MPPKYNLNSYSEKKKKKLTNTGEKAEKRKPLPILVGGNIKSIATVKKCMEVLIKIKKRTTI
jgi:hypothetical protein